jgi:hypothetical protein
MDATLAEESPEKELLVDWRLLVETEPETL